MVSNCRKPHVRRELPTSAPPDLRQSHTLVGQLEASHYTRISSTAPLSKPAPWRHGVIQHRMVLGYDLPRKLYRQCVQDTGTPVKPPKSVVSKRRVSHLRLRPIGVPTNPPRYPAEDLRAQDTRKALLTIPSAPCLLGWGRLSACRDPAYEVS
jgi:hypothetical protein